MNKPKQIGTFGETAVLKQVRPYFPDADRLTLSGAADRGDIGHCGEFIFEVKAGRQTDQIGDGKLAKWMEEAAIEANHFHVQYGVLVTQRRGFGAPNARRWWCWVRMEDFAELCGGFYAPGRFATVRLELGDFLELLADQGYTPAAGDPVTDVILAPVTHSVPVPAGLETELIALGLPAELADEDELANGTA